MTDPAGTAAKRDYQQQLRDINEALLVSSVRQHELTEKAQQAETALRESEERFRTLADNISQLAWTADANGRLNWYNQRWYDYTGTTPDEMQDWDWRKAIHPDHFDRVVERMQRSWDTGETWEDTFPLRGNDGNYRWFLSRALPIRDQDGHVMRWFGTNTDITDRNRMETQLRDQAAQLADLHRRKDEFLAMLSHELRNPLAPIINALHLLRLQPESDNQLALQARAIIERQVGQLKHLIDDLLDVSRITTGRVHLRQERVSMAGIVERPLIERRRHTFNVSLPSQVIWIHGDAARLEQVVVNLLTNAAKYTDEGGQIWLTVQQEGNAAVLRVQDTGVGIHPDLLPHIFDLFTQADRSLARSEGGLGIGLSLVRRLVELHGGTVEAHSLVGQGSEFVVRLPVMLAAFAPQSAKAAGKGAQPARSLRVLVVDDNVDAAQSLAVLMRILGHDVRMVHDGPAALEAAVEYRPDVVLLDIGLPGLNGFDVAKRLRSQGEFDNVVLVALTGYGRAADQQQARDAGFDHHLVKPADFKHLESILATV
jgi:PAS domain S-box-containing protein